MTDNATPKKRPGYSRPTQYPARLAVMLTEEQRAALDELVTETGASLGEVTRALIDDGLVLREVTGATRDDVRRLAAAGETTEGAAVEIMLHFAARESERRIKRDGRIAAEVAQGLADAGFDVDGVSVD